MKKNLIIEKFWVFVNKYFTKNKFKPLTNINGYSIFTYVKVTTINKRYYLNE